MIYFVTIGRNSAYYLVLRQFIRIKKLKAQVFISAEEAKKKAKAKDRIVVYEGGKIKGKPVSIHKIHQFLKGAKAPRAFIHSNLTGIRGILHLDPANIEGVLCKACDIKSGQE